MTSKTVQIVSSWLRSKFVLVPDDWIFACLEWMQSENHDLSNIPAVRKMVYEQWLLTDLRDFGQSTFPPQIAEDKYTLKGTYCVQVDNVLDASQPKYSQLLQRQNKDSVNTLVTAETQATQKPWEMKPSRMLMLSITDGVKDVSAMEYSAVPKLNIKMPPGIKIMIRGPVVCRRGVLMLKQPNIEVLGGEVEDLLASNNYDAMLCTGLNRPISTVSEPSHPPSINMLSVKEDDHIDDDDDDEDLDQLLADVDFDCEEQKTSTKTAHIKSTEIQSNPITISDDDDSMDDFLANVDLDDAQQQIVVNRSNDKSSSMSKPINKQIKPSSSILLPKVEKQHIMTVKNINPNIGLQKNRVSATICPKVESKYCPMFPTKNTSKTDVIIKKEQVCGGQSTNTTAIMMESKSEDHIQTMNTSCIPSKTNSKQSSLCTKLPSNSLNICPPISNENNQVFLCQVRQKMMNSQSEKVLNICIKAIVITLLSKLKNDILNGWSLKARICDGTGTIDVEFSNNVLESIIGFTVDEAESVKQSPNISQRNKLKAGLERCRETIISMCHHMNIKVSSSDSCCLEGFITHVAF